MQAAMEIAMTVLLSPAMSALMAGVGAGLASALLLDWQTMNLGLLIAPFGATCVLLFAAPQSPFSRKRNVIGGYLLCGLSGLLAAELPLEAFNASIALALAIASMVYCQVVHPPAGAIPIIMTQFQPDWTYVVFPVLTGALLLLASSHLFNGLKTKSLSVVSQSMSHKGDNNETL
ncbi:hypothetical protein R50073_28400 [Maricurvus nonylphenolicus]|uniref:HPP family protein n=1 Tax=Maricurvus nonylphenolicus TaxID=1008307 RepID=UPI0036F44A30